MISTDSEKIQKLALKNGFLFLGKRPKSLSGDHIETKDVLKFEINRIEKKKKISYENILLLQATCPFRDFKKIYFLLKKIKSKKFDSVVSVARVDAEHPLRMKKFKSNYLVNYIKQKKKI